MIDTAKKDGGPAFPRKFMDDSPGMTLRDWFAGQVIGHVATDTSIGRSITAMNAEEVAAHLARLSYAIADAMLAERSK
jgi:hypothetical protein